MSVTFASDVPFTNRLLALLREPTTWESLSANGRKRAINDFFQTQDAAVAEHAECKNRLEQFFDQMYSFAEVRQASQTCVNITHGY